MSTRAIIARPRSRTDLPLPGAKSTGFFGRLLGLRARAEFDGVYHHNEGYPAALGELLFDLVKHRYRGDVARAWAELIDGNPAGWSNLFPLGAEPLRSAWNGSSKVTAGEHFASASEHGPSLPVTYQGDPQRDLGFKVPPVTDFSDKMGAAFVYVIAPSNLVLFSVGDDGVSCVELRRFAWSEAPDWQALGF